MAIRIAYVVEGPPPGEVCAALAKTTKRAPRLPPMWGEAKGHCLGESWTKVLAQVFESDIFCDN